MVKRIIDMFSKEVGGLHEAAYLLAVFAFLSQVLGLFRDRLIAGNFGATGLVDIYYASFRIPDLIYVIITFLVSSSILVPIFSKDIFEKNNLKNKIDTVFTVFISLSVLIALTVFIFAPYFLKILVPGISLGQDFETLVLFTRVLLLSPLFLGISQLFGSIVQVYRRFFIYAISPILYNIGIIFGIIYLYPKYGEVGLVSGVVLGSLLHLIIQLPFIASVKLIPKITYKLDLDLLKKILTLSLPRTITMTSSQISLLFLVGIASLMTTGSIAIFNFAYNLQSVPLSIIGVSYSLAAFPTLAKLFAEGQKELFFSKIITSTKHIIFWSVPVIIMFIVLRAQIVRTILGTGNFSWQDTRLVAAALAIFSISVLAQSLILLFVRSYYAIGETKRPLLINVFSIILMGIFALILQALFRENETFRFFFEGILRLSGTPGTEIIILPLAFSIGMLVNVSILWISFENKFPGFSKSVIKTFMHSIFASVLGGYATYLMLQYLANVFDLNTVLGVFSQGFISGIIGLILILIILIMLDNAELKDISNTLHKKIWRVKPVVEGQPEL